MYLFSQEGAHNAQIERREPMKYRWRRIGLWVLRAATAATIIVETALLVYRPFPIPDQGSFISINTSAEMRDIELDIAAHFGFRPVFQVDSSDVQRLMFANGHIVNLANATIQETLGYPVSCYALPSENPREEADWVVRRLASYGYDDARVHVGLEKDIPPEDLVFVTSRFFGGGKRCFIVRKPAKEMGGAKLKILWPGVFSAFTG